MSNEALTTIQQTEEWRVFADIAEQKEVAKQRARAAFVGAIVDRLTVCFRDYLKEKRLTGFEPFEEESSLFGIDEVLPGFLTDMTLEEGDLPLGSNEAFTSLFDDVHELERALTDALRLQDYDLPYSLSAYALISNNGALTIAFK